MHRQNQHGVAKGGLGQYGDEEGGSNNPRTFRMSFSENAGPSPYPVEGVVDGRRRGNPCGYTSGTGASGTLW